MAPNVSFSPRSNGPRVPDINDLNHGSLNDQDLPFTTVDPHNLPLPPLGACQKRTLGVVKSSGGVEMRVCLISFTTGTIYALSRHHSLKSKYGTLDRAVVVQKRADDGLFQLTHEMVMVKSSNKRLFVEEFENRLEDPFQEVATLQHLSSPGHQNVGPMRECMQDNDTLYLVMPFLKKGDLIDHLNCMPRCRLPEESARQILVGLVSGLSYLQEKGICHRDLSPENLMVDQNAGVKIIDLGMSLHVPKAKLNDERVYVSPQPMRGKMSCMAPEIYEEKAFDAFGVDVWACGTILVLMLLGQRLYRAPLDEGYNNIMAGRLDTLLETLCRARDVELSEECLDLIRSMLKVDPRDRISVDQILSHPWVVNRPA